MNDLPDSECPAPVWERGLTRVTVETDQDHKLPCSVRGHTASGECNEGEEDASQQLLDHKGELAAQSPAISTTGVSSPAVFAVTCARVTSATEATTIALPARMYASTRSCRISQPRKTATTGLT